MGGGSETFNTTRIWNQPLGNKKRLGMVVVPFF